MAFNRVCVRTLLVLALTVVVNTQTCIFINGDNGDVYNLLPLQGQVFQANSAMYTYVFSPCANIENGPEGTAAQLIQAQMGNPDNAIAPVSIWDATLQWSMVNVNNPMGGVQMTTMNGAPPTCPNGKGRAATMVFNCGPQGSLQVVVEPPGAQCSNVPGYTFSLTTPYACPNAQPTGCPYTVTEPCVIKSFVSFMSGHGTGYTILFNEGGNDCGGIVFTPSPTGSDTCATANGNSTDYMLTGFWDNSAYNSTMALLEIGTPQNPILFFWDDLSEGVVLGPVGAFN